MKTFFNNLFGGKSRQGNKSDEPINLGKEHADENVGTDQNEVDALELPVDIMDLDNVTNEKGEQKGDIKPDQANFDLRDYQYPERELFNGNIQEILSVLNENPLEFALPILWSYTGQQVILKDLVDLKNVLIIGTQATGKTSFLHQLIISLLLKKHPSQIKLMLVDIKGLELQVYRVIEKHFLAKLSENKDPILKNENKTVHSLNALCIEMDNRYDLLRDAEVRNIVEYNSRFINRKLDPKKGHQYFPSLILFIDDLGGYTYQGQSDIILPLIRIVKDGYKVGIYSIISTSQANGQALPGDLLSLIAQRALFRLNSKEEYRKFFDTTRLNTPLQLGSFLYNENGLIKPGQTILFPVDDIENIVSHISKQRGYPNAFLLPEYVDEKDMEGKDFDLADRDPLFENAARLVVQVQIGSTSLIQRRMKLGYNRAGRLLDQLEAAGIVGPSIGSKVRDVLIKTETDLSKHLMQLG